LPTYNIQRDAPSERVLVKFYRGSEESAAQAYRNDATLLAEQGYFPTAQSWAPGSYGCGSFIGALVLCVILIGILIFIYMLLVKPAGTLTVTYELRNPTPASERALSIGGKVCPRCAENIRAAALVCRFCGYELTIADDTDEGIPILSVDRIGELRATIQPVELSARVEKSIAYLQHRLPVLTHALNAGLDGPIKVEAGAMADVAADCGMNVLTARLQRIRNAAHWRLLNTIDGAADVIESDLVRAAAALRWATRKPIEPG
jgi:hypothetical protein